jgi:hypothetical protein
MRNVIDGVEVTRTEMRIKLRAVLQILFIRLHGVTSQKSSTRPQETNMQGTSKGNTVT